MTGEFARTESQPESNAPRPAGGRLPRRPFWFLLVFFALATLISRRSMDDPSMARVVATSGFLICSFNLLAWFYFRSPYPARLRQGVVLSVLALAAIAALCVRVESFSGSLIPTLKLAWHKAHDETLQALPANQSGGVDLLRQTPDDFPQFLGPNRDQIVRGTVLATDWNAVGPKLVWRQKVGAGWSGFAAVNGFALTMEQRGEEELVTCYAVETGEPQWSSAVEARHQSPLGHIGPRSTPTIYNGRVYAMGATGILRCLDGNTGAEIWRRDLLDEQGLSQFKAEKSVPWGRACSPLVAGGRLVVSIGGEAPGSSINVAALDLETGETIWEGGTQQVSYASPTLATLGGVEQVVMVNESSVTGHALTTGEQLWEHPWPGNSHGDACCSQPAILDDAHVLLSKGYGQGAQLFRVATDDDGNWETEIVWENRRVLKTKFSNVSILNGYGYALDDGVMCCVNLATGERMWKKGRFRYGQLLTTDNVILVLSERGRLALVEPSPDRFNELASIDAISGQTWNTLCLTGNRLLVRNSKEAACYQLPQ